MGSRRLERSASASTTDRRVLEWLRSALISDRAFLSDADRQPPRQTSGADFGSSRTQVLFARCPGEAAGSQCRESLVNQIFNIVIGPLRAIPRVSGFDQYFSSLEKEKSKMQSGIKTAGRVLLVAFVAAHYAACHSRTEHRMGRRNRRLRHSAGIHRRFTGEKLQPSRTSDFTFWMPAT